MDPNLALNFSKIELTEEDSPELNGITNDESLQEYQNDIQVPNNCNLIVNYLPHDIDDLSLKGLFMEFGEIVMTKVVLDRTTKKSLGYGFVKFLREDDAQTAIQRLNGFTIDHKCLKVSIARPPSLEIRNCKLYVTNLPKEYSEIEVVQLFKEFGEIIECRVLKDKNLKSNKGVAFVQFDNKNQANNALSLNGCQLEGGTRGLVVKFAEDQHKKREMTRLANLTSHNAMRYLDPMMLSQHGGAHSGQGGMFGQPHMGGDAGGHHNQHLGGGNPHHHNPQGGMHHQQNGHHNGHNAHNGHKAQHLGMQINGGVYGNKNTMNQVGHSGHAQQYPQAGIANYYASSLQNHNSNHNLAAPNIYAQSTQMQSRNAYGQLSGSVNGNNSLYVGNASPNTNGQQGGSMQALHIPPPPPIMSPYSTGLASPLIGGLLQSPAHHQSMYSHGQFHQMAMNSGVAAPPSPLLGGGMYGGGMQQTNGTESGGNSPNGGRKKGGRKTASRDLQINVSQQGNEVYSSSWNGQHYMPPTGSPLININMHLNSGLSPASAKNLGLHGGNSQSQPPGSPTIHGLYHNGSMPSLGYGGQKQPQYMQYAAMSNLYANLSPTINGPMTGGYDSNNGTTTGATSISSTINSSDNFNGSYSSTGAGSATGSGSSITFDVANLPQNASVDMLKEIFQPYGRVISAQLDGDGPQSGANTSHSLRSADPSGPPTPTARLLLQLSGAHATDNALRALNSYTASGSTSPLQVKIVDNNNNNSKQ